MKTVLALIIYGMADPFARTGTAPVVYTDGELPSSGLPSEFTGATFHPIIASRPGLNWGADPRHPAGSEGKCSLTLVDDDTGSLGTLFLDDPDSQYWGLDDLRITASATSVKMVNAASAPTAGVVYFLGNEAVTVSVVGAASSLGTRTLTLVRGRLGSTARVHLLRPSDNSPGEDGSQDRLYLRSKPDWDEGFYCGLYYFMLDQNGAVADYVLRRGVVTGEPTPQARPYYSLSIEFLEDVLNQHEIGSLSKVVSLEHRIQLTKMQVGRPQEVNILLTKRQAEEFFNEPLGIRGAVTPSASLVSNLNTRMRADADITYEALVTNAGDTWLFKINNVAYYSWVSEGATLRAVKLACTLQPSGFTTGATLINPTPGGPTTNALDPWFQQAITDGSFSGTYASGATSGLEPPTVTLRCIIRKSVVHTFLTLAISRDGSSGGTFDLLIGGVGAGLPAAYFNIGTKSGTPLAVATDTAVMEEVDELLGHDNAYYFDLSKGVSAKDFLTNEFIASQLLLGSLQSGLLTLRSWVHTAASTITLQPLSEAVVIGKRLSKIKRLDLSSGIRVLDLEPETRRSVRWQGTTRIKAEEVQPIRFWREGLNLTVADVLTGTLSQLVTAFYKQFGGAPRVYPVPIATEDYINDGVEFAASVAWADGNIPTPAGLGIDDDFFVIGVDLDYDRGIANLLLMQNNMNTGQETLTTAVVAPTLTVTAITPVSSTVADVTVARPDGSALDLGGDYAGLYGEHNSNGTPLRIDNYIQAPIGDLERPGSVEAFGTIAITGLDTLTLTIDSDYLRGSVASITDLLTANETKLNLADRRGADESLTGAVVESDAATLSGNYANLTPSKSLVGTRYTTG